MRKHETWVISAQKTPFVPSAGAVAKWLRQHHLHDTDGNRRRAVRELKKKNDKKPLPEGKTVSGQESAGDWQILYGAPRVGGVLTYVATRNKNRDLLLVITVACHRISAIRDVFFDDERVTIPNMPLTDSGNTSGSSSGKWAPKGHAKVFIEANFGSEHQAALPTLITDSGGQWTTNHRQRGCAHIYLKLSYDETLFPSGVPAINFDIDGRVVDQWSSPDYLQGYSSNAWICTRDFIENKRFGGGRWIQPNYVVGSIESDPFADDATTNEGADICQSLVDKQDGTQEYRYTINGAFAATESVNGILDKMLASFGGQLIQFGSSFNGIALIAPKYRDSVMTVTVADLLSEVQITTVESLTNYFGIIGGTYVDPGKGYEETDFPPVKFLFAPYGDREDISLPNTYSATMAQRLAKIEMLRRKLSLTVSFKARLNLYKLTAGDTFLLTIAALGWSEKIFEVQSLQITMFPDQNGNNCLGVEIVAKENTEHVQDWDAAEEGIVTTYPSLEVPEATTGVDTSPTNLEAFSGSAVVITTPTLILRVLLTWVSPQDAFVTSGGAIEVQFKKTSASTWIDAPDVPGDTESTYVYGVEVDTSYDFRVRGRQGGGAVGDWIQVTHTVRSTSSAPDDVAGLTSSTGGGQATFSWNTVTSGDIRGYRVKLGTAGDTWDTIAASTIVTATSYTTAYASNQTLKFFVKALTNAGAESANAASTTLNATFAAGDAMGVLGLTYS